MDAACAEVQEARKRSEVVLAEADTMRAGWRAEWVARGWTPPAERKVISLVGVSPSQMRSLAMEQGVVECDRSRILVGRRGEPDVLAPER